MSEAVNVFWERQDVQKPSVKQADYMSDKIYAINVQRSTGVITYILPPASFVKVAGD